MDIKMKLRLLTASALLFIFQIQYSNIYDRMQRIKDSAINVTPLEISVSSKRMESARIIMIVAYARTGSTFTGSIFREIPGAFYLCEPIRKLPYTLGKMRGNGTLSVIRRPWWHNKTKRMEYSLDAINSWISCNLSSVCMPIGIEKQSTPNVHGCCGKELFDSCLQAEEIYCQNAPVKAMKFIRLRMKFLPIFLQLYKNMKVIHLVRDPRGILNSRLFTRSSLQKLKVHDHCIMLQEDLKHSKEILLQYPDRLLIVNYENIADNPVRTARKMFKFAGLNFSNNIERYLKSETSSDRDNCRFCTIRKNSSETAMKWRTQLDANSANFIYSACERSNDVLGYLPLASDTAMRNFSIPSRTLVDTQQELLSSNYF